MMSDGKHPAVSQPLSSEHHLFCRLGTDFQVLFFPFNMPRVCHANTNDEGIEIVLIEDNSTDASIILDAIKTSKYKCNPVIHTNGVDALNYLRESSVSTIAERTLVLLDLILPGMNGLELLAQMRQDPRLKQLPVAILTASTQSHHISTSAHQNAVSYMTKPSGLKQFHTLTKALDELLGALFTPAMTKTSRSNPPSVRPTFIGQGNEGLAGNSKLG